MLFRFAKIAASLAVVLSGCSEPEISYSDQFTNLNPAWVVTADEAYEWASVKNDNLPTLTGSPEWLNYMAFGLSPFLLYPLFFFRKRSERTVVGKATAVVCGLKLLFGIQGALVVFVGDFVLVF